MYPYTRLLPRSSQKSGFSLVEMIGVLAIIAILAVVIVPKVFSTIATSRITGAIGSVNTVRTAVTEYAGRYGTIPLSDNQSRIDDLLVAAGLMDSRFTIKIGTQPSNPPIAGDAWTNTGNTWTLGTGGAGQTSQSRVICVNSSTTVPGTNGANFWLNGVSGNNLPTGSRVVTAVIAGVTAAEARELSLRIDGDSLSETTAATADNRGKVTYPAGTGTKNVYIYVAHQ